MLYETIFQDNFDTENNGEWMYNYENLANWNILRGSIDLIGNGGDDFLPGNGMYLDLDGTTGKAGKLESKTVFNLDAGEYVLQFNLAGSQRGDTNTVKVSLGGVFSEKFTLTSDEPFTTITRTISVSETTPGTLIFDHTGGGDQTGLLLDNVELKKVVSEPLNLTGTSGKDTLEGTNFNDTLNGLGGNDYLDGKGGLDSLVGGVGNDTYIVDNVGDIVTELAGEGTDLVKSSVSYQLPDNVENLTLTGNENLTGKGNQLNNKITGNTKNNRLFGYGGNDNLIGGAGNDSLFGGAGNDTLKGDTGNDYLSGGLGNDELTGGVGSDILSGGTGQDNFIFLNPNEGLDIITDFSIADDTIKIKASAFGFNSTGAIAQDQFVTGEGAIDSNDYFVYDNSTGILSFDSDANGALAPVPLVMLDNIPAITNADIVLF